MTFSFSNLDVLLITLGAEGAVVVLVGWLSARRREPHDDLII